MDAALLLTALAVRAGDRVDLLAADRRVRARVVGASRTEVLAAFTSEWPLLEPELIEPDIGLMAAAVLGVARQRCLVVLLTDLNPAAIELGLLPHAAAAVVQAQGADRGRRGPDGRPRWRPVAATPTAVYNAAAADGRAGQSRADRRRCCAGTASRSSTRHLSACPRPRRRLPRPQGRRRPANVQYS